MAVNFSNGFSLLQMRNNECLDLLREGKLNSWCLQKPESMHVNIYSGSAMLTNSVVGVAQYQLPKEGAEQKEKQ